MTSHETYVLLGKEAGELSVNLVSSKFDYTRSPEFGGHCIPSLPSEKGNRQVNFCYWISENPGPEMVVNWHLCVKPSIIAGGVLLYT